MFKPTETLHDLCSRAASVFISWPWTFDCYSYKVKVEKGQEKFKTNPSLRLQLWLEYFDTEKVEETWALTKLLDHLEIFLSLQTVEIWKLDVSIRLKWKRSDDYMSALFELLKEKWDF